MTKQCAYGDEGSQRTL